MNVKKIEREYGYVPLAERMDDFIPEIPDDLKCVGCKHRLPDFKFPNGKSLDRANNIKCLKFEEKPEAYMFGNCPLYETD